MTDECNDLLDKEESLLVLCIIRGDTFDELIGVDSVNSTRLVRGKYKNAVESCLQSDLFVK